MILVSLNLAKRLVITMTEEILAKVAQLLQDVLENDETIDHVVLCTNEGIVVAAVSRVADVDPNMLSTISAAINSAGVTTLNQIGLERPEYLVHVMEGRTVLTVIQSYFSIVTVYNANPMQAGFREKIAGLNSVLLRVELLFSSHKELREESLLARILTISPQIKHALLLTVDGLPLGSVGFEDTVKLAGLISSIFANGMTLSMDTEVLSIGHGSGQLMITKIDDTRLLAVLISDPHFDEVYSKILAFLATQV